MMDKAAASRLERRVTRLRMELLEEYPFFGILMMHLKPAVLEAIGTAATDGTYLILAPSFFGQLSEWEAKFVLLHEVMHCALGHCAPGQRGQRDPELVNIACDIVVNSILMEYFHHQPPLTLAGGEVLCMTPDGRPGRDFTERQVYDMLLRYRQENPNGGWGDLAGTGVSVMAGAGPLDDHSGWGTQNAQASSREWPHRVANAARSAAQRSPGSLPSFAQRLIGQNPSRQLNWRAVFQAFLQPAGEDYSYLHPDRRYSECEFLFPGLYADEESAERVMCFVDASGSVTDQELEAMAGELASARDQMNGRLKGQVHFFDTEVHPDGMELEDFLAQKTFSAPDGGGTNFECIFDYLRDRAQEPANLVVILTDGWADYPPQSAALGVPVLWLLTSREDGPPWGQWACLKV